MHIIASITGTSDFCTFPSLLMGFCRTHLLLSFNSTQLMFSSTIVGNIAFMETVTHEGREFLAIKMYVKDQYDGTCSIKFNNSNGLLTAYTNGTLKVGHQLILTQYDVRINSIRTHYTKDDQLVALKYPEVALTGVRAVIGASPLPKAQEQAKPVPTLEEVPF